MNKIYVEKENNVAMYFELLFRIYDAYAEYEEKAKILLTDEFNKEEYKDLLDCSRKFNSLINELSCLKELANELGEKTNDIQIILN